MYNPYSKNNSSSSQNTAQHKVRGSGHSKVWSSVNETSRLKYDLEKNEYTSMGECYNMKEKVNMYRTGDTVYNINGSGPYVVESTRTVDGRASCKLPNVGWIAEDDLRLPKFKKDDRVICSVGRGWSEDIYVVSTCDYKDDTFEYGVYMEGGQGRVVHKKEAQLRDSSDSG